MDLIKQCFEEPFAFFFGLRTNVKPPSQLDTSKRSGSSGSRALRLLYERLTDQLRGHISAPRRHHSYPHIHEGTAKNQIRFLARNTVRRLQRTMEQIEKLVQANEQSRVDSEGISQFRTSQK